MTKEEARKHLTDYIERTRMFCNETVQLPIVDEIAYVNINWNEPDKDDFSNRDLEHWTFKGLLKIAYDLEDKK